MSDSNDARSNGEVEQTISKEAAEAIINYKEPIGVSLDAEDALVDVLRKLNEYRSGEADDEAVAEKLAEASVRIDLLSHVHGVEGFSRIREERVEKLQERYRDSEVMCDD